MMLVGSSVSLSQLILDYPMLTGQAVRYGFAAVVLLLIARRSAGARVPTGRELLVLLTIAATGLAGFNACILIGLQHADPAVVGTFIGAAPLGLALLGPLQSGQRPSLRLLGAAAVVVTGTALVHGSGHADWIGVAAALGAFAGEVLFSLLAALVLPRLGAVRVSAYSCALAVPLLLAGAIPAGEIGRWRLPAPAEAATFLYLALGMTVVAFVCWFTGLQRLGVARAGMVVGLMPVATLVTAAVQAGQLPSLGQSAGVLIVGLGLAAGLVTRSRPTPELAAATAT